MQKSPPPRPKTKSADDLERVDALDAAESRASAALRLMNEQQARADDLEVELERLRAHARAEELQRQMDAVVKASQAQPKVELAELPKPSQRPGILTVQAKGLKVGIPLAILVPVLTAGWAVVQNYLETQRQVKALTTIITGYDARIASTEKIANDAMSENAKLKLSVAELSGYLVAVLPKAGVNVPGTGSPIQSDPLPLGARRQTPVNVRTPVPTPQ